MSIAKSLTACVSIMAVASAHAESRCPGNVSSLPLRVVDGAVVVVSVEINHRGPYDFVVDTGSQVTAIDAALALELNLKMEGTTGVSGVATNSRNGYVHLEEIGVGNHSVTNANHLVTDLKRAVTGSDLAVTNVLAVVEDVAEFKAVDRNIRGMLGEDFLSHFDVLIDNRQRMLCLDDSGALARAVEGKRVALEQPRGMQDDLPFTRPMIVSARLGAADATPVYLRLDSGATAVVLYGAEPRLMRASAARASWFKRVVNGQEQRFAVLPAQDIFVGPVAKSRAPIVVPVNAADGGVNPREDGMLPTMAFARVFISYSGNYAVLEGWKDRE